MVGINLIHAAEELNLKYKRVLHTHTNTHEHLSSL